MSFDFKKEYKEFYLPPKKPEIITIPKMNFIAVRGSGNPNEEEGEYKQALAVLYAIAYTIKMSYKSGREIEGFYSYVVPPLEGFWWQDGIEGADYSRKDTFHWISLIRLPDFVDSDTFHWAVEEASKKKKLDCQRAEFFSYEEGLCVQCMHIGSYDDEPATITAMDDFAKEKGYIKDITKERFHHEIYLSDPRKCNPERMKTVIRHPIKPWED